MKYVNKLKFVGLIALTLLVMPACTNDVYVEREKGTDLSAYTTYRWIQLNSVKGDSTSTVKSNLSDLASRKLKEAVDANLNMAGIRLDTKRPQVFVTYDFLQEKGLHQSSGFYGSPFTRWYFNPYAHGWYPLYYPSQFWGGYGYGYGEYQDNDKTITLSFIDARTNKTILQAWTTQHTNSRKITSKEIDRAVQDIFKKMDIGKNRQSNRVV